MANVTRLPIRHRDRHKCPSCGHSVDGSPMLNAPASWGPVRLIALVIEFHCAKCGQLIEWRLNPADRAKSLAPVVPIKPR